MLLKRVIKMVFSLTIAMVLLLSLRDLWWAHLRLPHSVLCMSWVESIDNDVPDTICHQDWYAPTHLSGLEKYANVFGHVRESCFESEEVKQEYTNDSCVQYLWESESSIWERDK